MIRATMHSVFRVARFRLLRHAAFASGLLLSLFVGMACLSAQIPIAQKETAADTDAQMPSEEWHFGFEMFRMLLEEQQLVPQSIATDVLQRPEQSVIVVLGRLEDVVPPRVLEDFCLRGGAVLLASDTKNSFGRIGEFRAGPVMTEDRANQYSDFPDCLTIGSFEADHPLLQNVGSLVLNRTGWIDKPRWFIPDWNILASLPTSTSPIRASQRPVIAQAFASVENAGPMFLFADQSLFTNGMLWHGDNAILAVNLTQLLSAGGRTQLLFVTDGTLLGSYQTSPNLNSEQPPPELPEELPEPDMQTMLKLANSVVQNVQESNVLNEALANRPRNVRPPYFRRGILFALLALALAFVIWKATAAGPQVQPAMPQRQMQTAHQLASGRKIQAQEFGLAASLLSRELCRELTGSHHAADWQRMLGHNTAADQAPFASKSQHKQLATVLELALNTRTVHISRRRFQSIGRSIQQLRQSHRQQTAAAATEATNSRPSNS